MSSRIRSNKRTIAFSPESVTQRAVSIQSYIDDSMPTDCQYEVIFQTPDRTDVRWRFFATLHEATLFAQQVRG
jgi:hypothetical protein